MPENKQGKKRGGKKGEGQQVTNLLQSLLSQIQSGKRKTGGGRRRRATRTREKNHFPIAGPSDLRHVLTPNEVQLCRNSIVTLFNQGGGNCTLLDSGGVSFSVNFMLPQQHTVRLIAATTAKE